MRINDVGLSRHLLYYKYARRKEQKNQHYSFARAAII